MDDDSSPEPMKNLVRAGREAYKRSQVLRDMYELFQCPAFQRLQAEIQNPDTAETLQMLFSVYQWVEEEYARFSPVERLGILEALMADPETRPVLVQRFNPLRLTSTEPPLALLPAPETRPTRNP